VAQIGGVVFPHLRRDAQFRAEESGSQFGNQFLACVAVIAETLGAEIPIQASDIDGYQGSRHPRQGGTQQDNGARHFLVRRGFGNSCRVDGSATLPAALSQCLLMVEAISIQEAAHENIGMRIRVRDVHDARHPRRVRGALRARLPDSSTEGHCFNSGAQFRTTVVSVTSPGSRSMTRKRWPSEADQ
jgi:hypothetical protein